MYILIDMPCYTVNVVEWSSSSRCAWEPHANDVKDYLVFGSIAVACKSGSVLSKDGRYLWNTIVDLCLGFMFAI